MKKSIVFGLLLVIAALGLVHGAGAQVVEEWVARYNYSLSDSLDDRAKSLAVDDNGNVYVTGYSTGIGTMWDYATIKYTDAGDTVWVRRYNGPGNIDDGASSLAVDGNGNVYVTGGSHGSGTGSDYATIMYNSIGQQQWLARYNGSGNGSDWANSLVVDNSGNSYVTGGSQGSDGDYATIKYNATGQQQWVARYNGPGNQIDEAYSLAVDGAGNVYVTGISWGGMTQADYATIKYNSAGQQQWAARYNGPGNSTDEATDLVLDVNGNVYVTGWSLGSGTHYDYATVKYDASGNQLWVARYNGPANNADGAYSMAIDAEGYIYVTGYSKVTWQSPEYATIRYDSNGIQQWIAFYNGPGNGPDEAYSLVIDGNSNVYVTGYSWGDLGTEDYATVKYNNGGIQQWAVRYHGPENPGSIATSLAVSSIGNVYVTGYSHGGGTSWDNYDYATIKYSQSPPLDVTLTPISPPIVIPANGGSFNFNASVVNNGPAQAPFYVWARDRYPDGTYTNNLLGPVNINPPVGVNVTRQRTQVVPSSWPAGVHYYIGYANPTVSYPATDADSFSWTKSTAREGGATVWEAANYGELFPGEEAVSLQPSGFSLSSISPNPFNATTAISYELRAASHISLKVYDISGKLVATLVGFGESDLLQQAGRHEVNFDGSGLPSGIYLAKLTTGDLTATQKLVLLK